MAMTSLFAGAATLAADPNARFHIGPVPVSDAIITMWVIMAFMIVASLFLTRQLTRIPQTRRQALVELIVEGLLGLVGQQMDRERAKKYVPVLGTVFLFILISNFSGMLPGAGNIPGFLPPTAVWGVTLGLAAVIAISVQIFGIKVNGLSHFRHLFQPLFLAPIMFILGVVEELVRPFSLSVRLFANVYAGETLLANLLESLPYGLPLLVMGLELILGGIQALIFTLLSTLYIATATTKH